MRSSSLRKSSITSRENQGVGTPQRDRQKLKQKQKLSQDIKAKYIQELQDRNRKLKYEIIKINEMLDQHKEKTANTKKQYKLIPNQTSANVLKKQLQNVYKLIKSYQHQINALQNKHSGGLITDKMGRMETIFKQKSNHLQKLKLQLIKLTKQSIEHSKRLKDNNGKQKMQNILLKYNDEIKVLRQKVRHAQQREKKKNQNAKKQYEYIKKLQKQLVQNGMSMDEIEELKKKNIYNHIYDKIHNVDKDQQQQSLPKMPKNNQPSPTKEQIQQVTIDKFNELKNQIKLYKKLHEDYQKKLQNLEKQKANQEKLTQESRIKLQQKQKQMSVIQTQVSDLKMKMRSISLKPNFQPPVPQPVVKKQKPKMSPTKLKPHPSNVKTITDQTHIKYDQKGQPTQKGQRFTDRTIMGKINNSKIVAVRVWTQKVSFAICGIQCTYKIGQNLKEGQQHINKQAKKLCTMNVMELADGDFIKSVSGHLSPNNIIQYLVFLSNSSIIGRFGVAKPTQKQFNFDIDDDQIPICMYGSLLNTMDVSGKKQISVLEQLGFEISRDKAYGKDQL